MNISNDQQTLSTALTLHVKLSPDSVVMDPTNVLQCPPKALILDKFSPMIRGEQQNLNVPPLKTPIKHRALSKLDRAARLVDVSGSMPPLPPRNPVSSKQQRPRRVNENEASSTKTRRAIFGNYWESKKRYSSGNTTGIGPSTNINVQNNNDNTVSSSSDKSEEYTQISTPPPQRPLECSSFMPIIESSVPPIEPRDFRMFAPPKEYACRSPICHRFAPVESLPISETLPPLPSPLRRLYSDENNTRSLHGMYPLVTPVPILRQSSYRSLFGKKKDSPESRNRKLSTFSNNVPFNLTQSLGPGQHSKAKATQLLLHATSSSSTSDSSSSNAVQFDPRVTVTEFEDSIERMWYDDIELDNLKEETVLLAQEYLITHAHEAEKYNKAKLDPVTGTFRKKALFSLPVLSSVVDDEVNSTLLGNHSNYISDWQEISKGQVKSILIVDPNKAILNLFRKSMYSMFPSACLHATQSGEEALKLVSKKLLRDYGSSPFQHRNYDLIIVEQRLLLQDQQQGQHEPEKQKLAKGSCSSMSEMEKEHFHHARPQHRVFTPLRKPSSFNEGTRYLPDSCMNMCGSDLLKTICEMEENTFAAAESHSRHSSNGHHHHRRFQPPSSAGAEASSLPTKSFKWKALLIGVSVQPDRDARTLQEAGADVIWGKPIPRVGDALRNQLLNALISKRRQSCLFDVNNKGENPPSVSEIK